MRQNASFYSRLSLLVGSAVALPSLFACLDHPLKPVEYEAQQEKQDSIALTVNKDVDILFVIDNSGSMGEEQATLAANFASFIQVLERPEVKANYRIGITTTDNNNPWCDGTSPEGGHLVLSSCHSRSQDFVFMGAETIDAFDAACAAVCPAEFANIQIQPTAIEEGGSEEPRPWIENIEGATNLPPGLEDMGDADGDGLPDDPRGTIQAFQCLGPQGINGCGFEEQLESMYKALAIAEQDDQAESGFIRDNAILAIVQVTDEVDCSFNKAHETIFLPEANGGNEVFWSNPGEGAPTSAVCWNAGVECTDDGSGGYECRSQNYNTEGAVIDSNLDSDAVMRPVSRYIDYIQGFEDRKQQITPGQEVLVAIIAGTNADGSVNYADTMADPGFQTDFGIGPGCQSEAGRAVPPVRMREFAESFQVGGAQNMFSICNSDYSAALEAIAEAIADQVKPACMPACVADTDPTTEILDPQCTLLQEAPQEGGSLETTNIPECTADGGFPNDEINVCYIALVDGARDVDDERDFVNQDATDDMSDYCADEGVNLEFVIVRRDGFPAPGGTSVKATCQLSQARAIDCPQLD